MFLPCYSCKNIGHLFEDCQFLHYIPNKELVIQKYNFTFKNDRNLLYKRKKSNFFHLNSVAYKKTLLSFKEKYEKLRKNYIDSMQLFQGQMTRITSFNEESLDEKIMVLSEENNQTLANIHSSESLENINIVINKKDDEKDESKELISPTSFNNYKKRKNTKEVKDFPAEKNLNKEFIPFCTNILRLNKKLLLKNEPNYLDPNESNLYDLNFEKAKDYQLYFPEFNSMKAIYRFKKYQKFREKSFKAKRNQIFSNEKSELNI